MEKEVVKALLESKVEGLPVLAIDLFVEPALKKVVEDSSNPVDNAIFAMVFPPLKAELEKMIKEALEKLKV